MRFAATAPMAGATPSLDATAPMAAVTAAMGSATRPMTTGSESTVPLVGDYTAVIGEDSDEIRTLRARAQETPNDPDLVFEFALALNETGSEPKPMGY